MKSFVAGFALLLFLGSGQASESPLLGSREFRPTLQQPFGWRGDGSGRFPGAAPVTEWSPTKNVRWRAVVGKSYASPILTERFVIVASEPDLLVCLDRADGKEKWKVQVTPASLTVEKARATAEAYKPVEAGTGVAAATPVTDGSTIYAVFGNGILRAIDLDGKTKWTAFIDAPQTTQYGRSASPILLGGRLIVHMTNLYAFDPSSGKQLWVNTESRCQYGTPTWIRQGQTDLIVTPAGDVIQLADGKGVNNQIGNGANSSPVAAGGMIYFAEKDVRAIRLGAEFKDESVWNSVIDDEVFGSPLCHAGLVFAVSGKGHLYGFDTVSKGEVKPVIEARPLFGDEEVKSTHAYASLTLAGNYIFLNSNFGETVVFEATRDAKPVARNKLKDGSGASPVFSGGDLFLRDGDSLYCIGR